MPRPQKLISAEQRRSALRLIFAGEAIPRVAEKVGLSRHLVTRVVDDFVVGAEEKGSVLGAAVSLGIGDQVNALIELSGEVKETGYKAAECADGARLIGKLRGIGVDDAHLDEFIDEFVKRAEEQDLSPATIADHAVEFGILCEETGKGYGQIVEEYRSSANAVKSLEAEIRDLGNRRAENQRVLSAELEEAKTSRQEIKWFADVRGTLLKDGVNVRDLDGLRNVLANVRERGGDPVAVAEVYSKHNSVSGRVIELEGISGELEEAVIEKKTVSSKLDLEIERSGALRDSLKYLEERHVDSGLVKAIADKVVEASARMGVTVKEAMAELKMDISERYEEIHGLRGEVTRLTARRDTLSTETGGLDERKTALISVIDSKQKALESLERLRMGGVSEEDLIDWEKIAAAQGFDVLKLRRDVENLGGFKAYVEDKTKEKRYLDETLSGLDDDISERRRQLEQFNARIVSAVDQLRLTTEEVETARSSLAKEAKNLQLNIKQMGSDALYAGREIGKYRDLNVIMLMMSGVDVNVGEGKVATLGLLKAVSDYLRKAGYRLTPRKVQEALDTFIGEMASV